ncbi:MAG TPA: lipopolysaccharide heptosyltransferase II [bacterium]|nr:lipopolysaccharide heptosyltransferase II [bacterium]HPN44295.1 lipopolysaccharide heptosyltransferase II [bacterium]
MQIKKILIIQTAFIGDVILTTPLIRWAKSGLNYPQIHVVVIPSTRNVVETNPFVDKIIIYDKRGKDKGLTGIIKLVRQLNKEHYSAVISPHRSLRSALIARLTGAKKRIGFNTSSGAFLYTDKIYYDPHIYEIDRNLSLLKFAHVEITDRHPFVFPDHDDENAITDVFSEFNIKTTPAPVAVAPGSVWFTKKWPEKYYRDLVKMLLAQGREVILTGGMADKECCERIVDGLDGPVVSLAGRLTLRQSAALYKKCAVLVCNDSGAMHLAVAVKTPVIALFGPTIPAFGFAPFGERNTVLEHQLTCRPCGIHGGNKCPIGTHECMQAIHPSQVLQSVLQYIKPEA